MGVDGEILLLLREPDDTDCDGLSESLSMGGLVAGGAGGGGKDLEFICLGVDIGGGDALTGLLGVGVGGIVMRDVGCVVIAVGITVRVSNGCCV